MRFFGKKNRYPAEMKKRYLDLLKSVLTGMNRTDQPIYIPSGWGAGFNPEKIATDKNGFVPCTRNMIKEEIREIGGDWPFEAETMIGMHRLENIEELFNQIIREKIPGDLIETGVWRGGATIFMRALLLAEGITDRKVWVADSFEGLPPPRPGTPADMGDKHHLYPEIAVSLEEVRNNFRKYNLLDDQVVFLKGWFHESLPNAPIENLALIRLDGDMYDSTKDALINLYPKLSFGGYVIADDYGAVEGCRLAIRDFRHEYGIQDEIQRIDWTGIFWKKNKRTTSP